jgi:hypothetical protein
MEPGVRTLHAITEHSRHAPAVRRDDLAPGDRLLVTTRNSVYTLLALGDGEFVVQGGWFDRNGASPATLGINGCTYGGTAIRSDVVAARGLFLEFANQVVTTRIASVRLARRTEPAPAA